MIYILNYLLNLRGEIKCILYSTEKTCNILYLKAILEVYDTSTAMEKYFFLQFVLCQIEQIQIFILKFSLPCIFFLNMVKYLNSKKMWFAYEKT